MKELPKEFKSHGFFFKQLKREGDIALFQKGKPTIDQAVSYEVVLVQKHDDYTIAGQNIPAHEAMPSNESWGTKGWSYPDLESANKKFRSLSK